jgi:hypothetical protein
MEVEATVEIAELNIAMAGEVDVAISEGAGEGEFKGDVTGEYAEGGD